MGAFEPLRGLLEGTMGFISGIAGVGFTIAFIIYGFKLASSAGNPAARANAISGLWFTGLGAIVSFGAPFIVRMLAELMAQV